MTTTLDRDVGGKLDLADLLTWATATSASLERIQQQWDGAVTQADALLSSLVVPMASSHDDDVVPMVVPSSLDGRLHTAAAVMQSLAPVIAHAPYVTGELQRSVSTIESGRSRRLFGRRTDMSEVTAAANRIAELENWARKTGYSRGIAQALEDAVPTAESDAVETMAAAAPALGMARQSGVAVLSSRDGAVLGDVARRGRDLLAVRNELVERAREDFAAAQVRKVERQLGTLEVKALHEASRGQVRVGALESGGIETVQQLLDRGMSVRTIPGVSEANARVALSTAVALQRECRDQLRLKVDWDASDDTVSRLVVTLHQILRLDAQLDSHLPELERLVELVEPMAEVLVRGRDVVFFHREAPRRGGDTARLLTGRAEWVRRLGLADLLAGSAASASREDAWADLGARVPVFQGLLGQLVGMEVDDDAAQGHLPAEVVRAVDNQALDTSFLSSDLRRSLRGYQAFGARYALAQRKVLLGDEMGLGKTIQALAAMAHLAAQGETHFLVVCPPAVVVNWIKETRKHSELEARRLHGPIADRQRELQRWRQRGGVAVTSYNLATSLELGDVVPGLLAADEAHFVKNPDTQRSQAVGELAERAKRVLYMTGTPLENRVEDFTNLVAQLQPQVVGDIDPTAMVLGADRFREAMAPVYLRRTQNDVLQEMPDLVESEDWEELSRAETEAYLDALDAKDFHGLRQVAMTADPRHSKKMERLRDLVEEALSNQRKILVYSYYRDVIETVRSELGDCVFGVITGSTSPDERQRLVDVMTESRKPGVLVSQIVAGGVGLNMQAASVVILCEPQVKPSLESQAIARAHRMGQVQSVQVHRLLTLNSVDERMLEILARKSELFEQLAGRSEVAETSAEAKDITEAALAKQVLARESERLAAELRERVASRPAEPATPAPEDGPVAEPSVVQRPSIRRIDWAVESAPRAHVRKSRQSSAPTSSSPRAAPAEPQRTNVCGSCDKPIDFNGHCGCS